MPTKKIEMEISQDGENVLLTLNKKDLDKIIDESKKEKTDESYKPLAGKKIVLDVGHGYNRHREHFDAGASNQEQNIDEYDLNLHMARCLNEDLEALGAHVLILSNKDPEVRFSLSDRYRYAEGQQADLFISLHHNAYRDFSVQGTETYYRNDSSENLAKCINDGMTDKLGFRNRGHKQNMNLGVIRSKSVLSVLTEPYFITAEGVTSQNCKGLTEKAARGVAKGVVNFFK